MKSLYAQNQNRIYTLVLILLAAFAAMTAQAQQPGATPTHFNTVWQDQNGQNHMNFIIISAELDHVSLAAGDEIAVFSGTACVGAKKLSEAINPANNSTFLTVVASQDDGGNNGFIENDTVIFKYWDHTNQIEIVVRELAYQTDEPTWLTSGKFIPGATAVVKLVSYPVKTQTIFLKKGYNLISANVIPSDPNLATVTQTIRTKSLLQKVQDEAGNSYENWGGSYGGWMNNIGAMKTTEGYKIKVAADCSLEISGQPVQLPLNIPLQAGWNIVSFPKDSPVDAQAVVQSLIDQNLLVKVQDETGLSVENWGIYGGWKNNIGNFLPGKAYKLKLNAVASLTIKESYLKSSHIYYASEKATYFSSMAEGNGVDQMNINLVNLNESGLSAGDELAAFDGNVCVGTLKLTANMIAEGTASLVASATTDNKEINGFSSGNPIKIYAWNQLSGNESEMNAEALSGQLTYSPNATIFARLKSATTGTERLTAETKIDVYPNPSVGKVNVRFPEMPEFGSRINVIDMTGRRVASREITGTNEMFDLSGQPSGMYVVETVIGSKVSQHKLIIAK
jgi:hypothetical protein